MFYVSVLGNIIQAVDHVEKVRKKGNDMKSTQFTVPKWQIFVTSGYKAKDPGISGCHNNNL